MYTTKAQYFDGKSSQAKEISISLDPSSGTLLFSQSVNGISGCELSELVYEKINKVLELRFAESSLEYILLNDEVFIKELNNARKQHKSYSLYQKLLDMGMAFHALLALGIMGLIVVVYLFVLPVVAENAIVMLPETYEEQLGVGVFESYMEYATIDSVGTTYLTEFVEALEFDKKNKIKVTVVQSNEINAFALPDGNIVVFSGILKMIETPSELAALLGHEIAHITNRHSMKMMARNLAGYLFISVVLSDVNGIMGVVAENAHSLQNMSYSRAFEKEADIASLEFLKQNKLHVDGAIDLFEHLNNEHSTSIPTLLSSHPLTDDRIGYLRENIADHNEIFYDTETMNLAQIFEDIKMHISE